MNHTGIMDFGALVRRLRLIFSYHVSVYDMRIHVMTFTQLAGRSRLDKNRFALLVIGIKIVPDEEGYHVLFYLNRDKHFCIIFMAKMVPTTLPRSTGFSTLFFVTRILLTIVSTQRHTFARKKQTQR